MRFAKLFSNPHGLAVIVSGWTGSQPETYCAWQGKHDSFDDALRTIVNVYLVTWMLSLRFLLRALISCASCTLHRPWADLMCHAMSRHFRRTSKSGRNLALRMF